MRVRWLGRLVRFRFPWIAVLGLVGLVAGATWAVRSNREITPQFEAVVTVHFAEEETERDAALEQLNEAGEIALRANISPIEAQKGRVTVDDRVSELIFISQATDSIEAEALARQMRDNYFEQTMLDEDTAKQDRMAEILGELDLLLTQLDQIQPEEVVVEAGPEVSASDQAQLDFLNSLVNALIDRSSKLSIDLILAESGDDRVGDPENLQAQLDFIEVKLDELYVEISIIPGGVAGVRLSQPDTTDPGDTVSDQTLEEVENSWAIAALASRLLELQSEYEDLYIAQTQPQAALETALGPVQVSDITDPHREPLLFGGLGFVLGMLAAIGVSSAEARFRGRLFVAADLGSLKELAELPESSATVRGSAKRTASLMARRKKEVQVLRQTVIENIEKSAGVPIIAFGGAGVGNEEVQALVFDLALGLRSADVSVLLMNLDFVSPANSEESGNDPTVAGLLSQLRRSEKNGHAELQAAMATAEIVPGLRGIDSGKLDGDATDFVLTQSFQVVFDEARRQANVVLVMLPHLDEPSVLAIASRIDGLIAVCQVGWSQKSDITEFQVRSSAPLLGWVLLTNRGSSLMRLILPSKTRARHQKERRPWEPPQEFTSRSVDKVLE